MWHRRVQVLGSMEGLFCSLQSILLSVAGLDMYETGDVRTNVLQL